MEFTMPMHEYFLIISYSLYDMYSYMMSYINGLVQERHNSHVFLALTHQYIDMNQWSQYSCSIHMKYHIVIKDGPKKIKLDNASSHISQSHDIRLCYSNHLRQLDCRLASKSSSAGRMAVLSHTLPQSDTVKCLYNMLLYLNSSRQSDTYMHPWFR